MKSFLSRSFAVLSATVLLTTAVFAQGVKVCMSLHGGPAAGVNSLNGPAQVAGRVNGVQVSVPTAPGMGAGAASAAHQAAFAAAGFATVRVNANEFCVTAGPGGAPIISGLCYGTDDMGFDLDSSVGVIPPVGGPPVGVPAPKPGGVVVPVPPVQQPPLPQSGTIRICFDVWIFGVRVRICITITLQMGIPGIGLQQMIQQQLRQNGFESNPIKIRNPLPPYQLIDALQVERMTNGDLVDGVEYQYDAMSRRIVQNYTGAGVWPEFGAAEYGFATRGLAPRMPWSHVQNPPLINNFFDVFHQVELPNLPGGIVINLTPASVPLLNGTLLVQPAGMVFEFGISDVQGLLHRRWNVPNNAGLLGLPICSQGGVVHPAGQVTLSTGIKAVVGR